jgi:hypothetical protein
MFDSESDWYTRHVSFRMRSGDPCDQPDCGQILFLKKNYLTSNPHESCSPVCLDEFGVLNRLISISEAQDIPL